MLEFISGSIRPWPGHLYTRGRTPLSKNLSCARIFSFLPRRLLALGTPSSVACTSPPAPLALRAFTGRAACSFASRVPRPLLLRVACAAPLAPARRVRWPPRTSPQRRRGPPMGQRCRHLQAPGKPWPAAGSWSSCKSLCLWTSSNRLELIPPRITWEKIEGNSFQIPGFPISQCSSFEVISLSEKLYLVS